MIRTKLCIAAAAMALIQPAPLLADKAQDAVAAESRTDADRALDAGRQPTEVLRFSGIEAGQSVADFMAGDGYFTAMIADLVGPGGVVYAVNPVRFHNPEVWKQRLAAHANIRTMAVPPRAMQLAPGSVDTIFAHLVFHDLYWESERYEFPRLDVDGVLANWFAAIRPGGQVIVVDHMGPAGDPREVTGRLHRIAPDTVIAAMTGAGFRLTERSDMLRRSEDDHTHNVFDEEVRGKTDRFVMKFQKPGW